MDLNSRRQHVNRATSGFDHIPAADQTEAAQPLNSFTFTPSEVDQPVVMTEEGLSIPKGAPSLFEATTEDAPDERLEQPSPLHPYEVVHADSNQSDSPQKSLEDKFAQAINNLEPTEQQNQPEALASTESVVPGMEQAMQELPNSTEDTAVEPAQSTSVMPHSEHFAAESSTEITSKHGDDDAGLGATFMSERARLKQEQGVG